MIAMLLFPFLTPIHSLGYKRQNLVFNYSYRKFPPSAVEDKVSLYTRKKREIELKQFLRCVGIKQGIGNSVSAGFLKIISSES